MTGRTVALVVSVVLGGAFLCVGGLFALAGASSACSIITAPSGTTGRYDAEQVHYAQVIVAVGIQHGVPVRGQVVAVATALQESGLRNLGNLGNLGGRNDHDSVGLFQQRPSQGWGTPAQLMDPEYAAGAFYRRLVAIPGWQTMPLTVAAQAVQRSAYPDAYAKWEGDATVLVGPVGSGNWRAIPEDLEQCMSICPTISNSSGANGPVARPSEEAQRCTWVAPVRAPIVSGFRTEQRPTHDGVDLGAARGAPIKAAAAGAVTVVRCNVVPASHGCDVDGSPQTPGCGWYVDIEHADGIVTRYCHMLVRPYVHVGQSVGVGQIIGLVGSSGHSSGPHLHFEVHLHGDHSSAGAVDPVPFMASQGAPLGQ